MKKGKKIIIAAISVVIAAGIAVGFYFLLKADKSEEAMDTEQIETTTEEPTTVDPYAGKVQSYLTGEYVSEKKAEKRPVAVMYNNIINAIPQSGISQAKILYEAPVEGSITRLMAIFDDISDVEDIGSIRSCRLYYAKFALEWDAIYVHYGQSKYALSFLQSDSIDNVGSYNAGNYFYRKSGKSAPHNLYADGEELEAAIDALGYETKHTDYDGTLQFTDAYTEIEISGKTADKVEIGYAVNQPYYKYNSEDKKYYRYQYDAKHVDSLNDEQLSFDNIIIQFVDSSLYDDGKSLNITLTGTGTGWYITRGQAEKIIWKKKSDTGQTTFYDKDGEEIVLNIGKTSICIVQSEYSDNVVFS